MGLLALCKSLNYRKLTFLAYQVKLMTLDIIIAHKEEKKVALRLFKFYVSPYARLIIQDKHHLI